ncbi:MAG: signal peptidase I [Acutalibacteraceae bacterium]
MADYENGKSSYDHYVIGVQRPRDPDERKDKKKNSSASFTKSCYEWMQAIASAIIIVVIILTFVFRMVEVSGSSMENTLLNEDKVIVTNLFYTPKPGDIVVISHGAEYDKPIIKRVIAVGGQTLDIDFETGVITVDGEVIDEPYIDEELSYLTRGTAEIPSVIKEGEVFVLGDNRPISQDSRYSVIGTIPVENIIGKAQFIIYPFDRIRNLY